MRARDVMTEGIVCLHVNASIFEAAELLLGTGISAVPIIDGKGVMVGIVSEADLIRRAEIGTTPKKSWLSRLLADDTTSAHDFVRSHSRRVAEVMTREVVTADEDAELSKLAELMERHGVKRIPIVRDGVVQGIVSRADLLQALLSREAEGPASQPSDGDLRRSVIAALEKQGWKSTWPTNVFVNSGVVHLWGYVSSEDVRKAYRVAAENVAGVKKVKNHLRLMPASVGMGT